MELFKEILWWLTMTVLWWVVALNISRYIGMKAQIRLLEKMYGVNNERGKK